MVGSDARLPVHVKLHTKFSASTQRRSTLALDFGRTFPRKLQRISTHEATCRIRPITAIHERVVLRAPPKHRQEGFIRPSDGWEMTKCCVHGHPARN
jgi:hypothetical protein